MASRAVLISASAVIGLLVGLGGSYLVSAGQISSLQASLSKANESNTMLLAETQNVTTRLALTPKAGQMIRSGWIFIAPVGTGRYAVFLHAEGLEPPSRGGYIVEGVTKSGMKLVLLGPNETASEFDAGTNGIGNYWLVLNQNPSVNYEAIDVLYLAGMQMSNAALVASVNLG